MRCVVARAGPSQTRRQTQRAVSLPPTSARRSVLASLLLCAGLIPTIPEFPTAKKKDEATLPAQARDGDGGDDGYHDERPTAATPDERRRILQLEQTLRTRALVDDMINSLE
jgi:hypothetical protein